MIGFLGYNFCADTNALDPVPTDVSKLQIVQVENGIYDHINITSDVTGTYPSVPPTGWDFKTILDCDFRGNISGGSSDNISKDVTSIRIKRRAKGTYAWITIKEIPVASAEDLNFAFTDNLNLNNTLYEYAYVPVTQGVEGGYTVEEIESEFRGVFICDTDTIYKFYYGVSYGDTDRVQQVGVYTPYGRQYPVVISNGLLSYETGSVQGQVLPESFDKDRQMDRAANVAERGILFDFLTNHKAKIIKDWNGNSWLCCITGNPSVSYSRGSGMGMMTAKADWTQIGQADNAGDLYAAGLIPREE